MDGFNIPAATSCGPGPEAGTKPYQYVTKSDIAPYWDIAKQWVLADAMFQTQGSGSFTAHQDLIRGGTCIQACVHLSDKTETIADNDKDDEPGAGRNKPVLLRPPLACPAGCGPRGRRGARPDRRRRSGGYV